MNTTHAAHIGIEPTKLGHALARLLESILRRSNAALASDRHRLSSALAPQRSASVQPSVAGQQDRASSPNGDEIVRQHRERALLRMVREGIPF